MKSRKTDNRKRIENQLDDLWRRAVLKRWGNKCAVCHKSEGVQSAHIFSRKNKSVRWDILNGISLCSRHHLFWAHKEPIEFAKFVEEKIGKEELEKLSYKAHQTVHYSIDDLLEIKRKLEEFLKEN